MESVMRMKKTLRMPIRKLGRCVSGLKKRRLFPKHRRRRRSRGGRGHRGCNMLGRTPAPRAVPPKAPTVIRSYQPDLDRERQSREEMNTQKNAERAAMRSHFRRKYELSESRKDKNHLRSVGGKVSLPHELSRMINPETKTKDDGFNLLTAFQGLSFKTAAVTSGKHRSVSTNRDSCKVM
ncbi:complexin-4-like [Cololabis saira]|uniref:complexin-4-like n=1 Tax=Cololabis saira TaxID=129043 RepID=UPI002AD5533E|nr:complexin-4-like [Cololabis saira]